jgi:hypothetical protein
MNKKVTAIILGVSLFWQCAGLEAAYRKSKPRGNIKPPAGSAVNWGDPISNGLVRCWLVNDGGGLYVTDIAKGNRGTLTNGPTWTAGMNGQSIRFDGSDDYIAVSKTIPTVPDFPFTLSAWVEGNTSDTAYRKILTVGSDTANRGWFLISARPFSSTIMRFGIEADNNDLGGGTETYNDTTNFSGSRWYFVVGVFSSATDRRLYVNGNLLASRTGSVTFNPAIATGTTFIGAGNLRGSPVASSRWLGRIDNARVWRRALLPSEIQRLYTEPFAGIVDPKLRMRSGTAAVVAPSNIPSLQIRNGLMKIMNGLMKVTN